MIKTYICKRIRIFIHCPIKGESLFLKPMHKLRPSIFLLLLLVALLPACNTTKFVPEGDYLLDKVTIHSDAKNIPKDILKGYLRQTPNPSVLGIFRLQLGIYNLAGTDSTKWVNRMLMGMGHGPVIYSPLLADISREQLQLYMNNKGYWNAYVQSNVVLENKKARVNYVITSNEPYKIEKYATDLPDESLSVIANDTLRSLIKKEVLFDVDILENERSRIASTFRQFGYYNFNKEFLTYEADTTLLPDKVDLTMVMHDNLKSSSEEINELVFKQYGIQHVYFVIDSEQSMGVGASTYTTEKDTIQEGGYFLVTPKENFLRFKTLIQSTYVRPDTRYSDFALERTYSSLNSLPPVKYVNINYQQVGDTLLDCHIYIVPAKSLAFSTEAEVTYTEGYWGVAGGINTQHRNIFGGAELLSIQARMALEKQEDVYMKEFGGQVGLQFPNFLVPFVSTDFKRRIRAKTEFTGTFSFQSRPQEYVMVNVGGGLKYIWNWRRYRHTFELLDLSYVYFPDISEGFKNQYIETGIYNRYHYTNHLIMRMGYSGTRSNFMISRPLMNYSVVRYNVETAGNLLYAYNSLSNKEKVDDAYSIFNIRFAQYAKGEFNYIFNQVVDAENRFVYRAGLGVGVPYGNADVIPYERRFFSGGANSVRGWSESTLGPGVYQKVTPSGRRDYNQTGDIKLDLNFEYRTKMFWLLEGALFLDAGNIWTIREYDEQPGGVFRFDSFLSQMAIAYGAGIRADFSFFILRVDVGLKLHNPNLPRLERWRVSPKRSDFALHFAIGYPF